MDLRNFPVENSEEVTRWPKKLAEGRNELYSLNLSNLASYTVEGEELSHGRSTLPLHEA